MAATERSSDPRILAGLCALAAAVFTWNAWGTWASVVDDAYISARYAEHLAEGWGLVYNRGEPPVEGYTNLLWTVLLAAGRVVGLPMLTLMTSLGWAFGLVTMGFAVAITRTLTGSDHPLVTVPAFALALSPHLAVSATNGIESSMMSAMVLGTVWGHLALRGRRRWVAGLLAGGLLLTRPEGIVVVGLVALHDLWLHRRDPKGALPLTGVAVAFGVALLGFRLITYGALLPNTWHAKASFELTDTFRVNRNYLNGNRNALLALLGLWAVSNVLPPYRFDKYLVSAVAMVLGLIPLTVNLWMPGLRLFLATGALTACLLGAALLYLPRRAGLAGATVGLAASAWFLFFGSDHVRAYDSRHTVLPGNGTELAARHLAAHAPEGSWVATRDAGCFAYWVGTGVKVAELHQRALTQPHPNRAPAAIRDYTPVNPEFFVGTVRRHHDEKLIYGNDRIIFERFTMPYVYLGRVNQHFHRFYDVYARADVGMPPLPEGVVVNRNGPRPRLEVEPGEPPALVAEPLPDTGL